MQNAQSMDGSYVSLGSQVFASRAHRYNVWHNITLNSSEAHI